MKVKSILNKMSINNNFLNCNVLFVSKFNFTGKTETGHKFTTPYLTIRKLKPIYPPPGLNLKAPEGWTLKKFFEKIGGDCHDIVSKFENIEIKEVLDNANNTYLSKKEIPIKQRKYLLRIINDMRRGLITWEYLERRIHTAPCRKLTIPSAAKAGKAKKKEEK